MEGCAGELDVVDESCEEIKRIFRYLKSFSVQYIIYPRANGAKRRSGRKPGARVTNSARLFTPGKMRTQRSVKSINNRGRITLAHGWTSH